MLTTIEKLMYLRVVPTFAQLELEAVRALAEVAITVTYRAGEPIFVEGEGGDCLFVVTEGRVALTSAATTLAELGSREHFGEMSLFDSGRRSAGATALRDTTLLRVDHDDFYRLGHRHPEILAGVISVLSARLRAANAQLAAP